jgi:TolB-like protein
MSVSQHAEFAAVTHLAEGQVLRDAEKIIIVSNITSRNSLD